MCRSRSPALQPAHHPPSSLRCVSVGPPAAVSFPARSLGRDGCESLQISSPLVPEQRNGGRQPPGTCCLFTPTPSAHKTGKSQDVCARWGRGVGPGRSGWKREGNAALATELAKEVELTSVKIFPFTSFLQITLHGQVRGAITRCLNASSPRCCCCFNPHGTRSSDGGNAVLFWCPSTPRWRCPAVYWNQHSHRLHCCFHTLLKSLHIDFFYSPPRPSTLRTMFLHWTAIQWTVPVGSRSRCWDQLQ